MATKERAFCEAYLISRNGTEAAIVAGYSKEKNRASAAVTACRLLRKDAIKAYIAGRTKEIWEQLAVSPESVSTDLMSVYRKCIQAEQVIAYNPETRKYEPTGEFRFDSLGAVKALELIGKHLRMFEKVEEKSDKTITVVLSGEAKELSE